MRAWLAGLRRRLSHSGDQWSSLATLYATPGVRVDGKWLRPLLPRDASTGASLLLGLLSAVMLGTLSVSLPPFMRQSMPAWLELVVLASATAAFVFVYWVGPTLRRTWFVYPFAGLAAVVLLRRYAPWILELTSDFIGQVWVTAVGLRQGAVELIPLPVAITFVVAAHIAYTWLLIAFVWRRSWTTVFVIAGGLLFTWEWLFYYDPAFQHAILFIVAGMLALVVRHGIQVRAEWLHARSVASGEGRSGSLLFSLATYGLVAVLAITLMAQLLPTSIEPFNLGEVGTWFRTVFPIVSRLRGGTGGSGDTRFSLARTGFSSGDNQLGGPVVVDETNVLTVRLSGSNLPSTLYLRGAVRDEYTGHGWGRARQPTLEFSAGDRLPQALATDVRSRLIRITVLQEGLRTNSLFAPWSLRQIRSFDPEEAVEKVTATPALDMWAPNVIRPNQSYSLEARLPLYSTEQLRQLSIDDDSYLDADPADLSVLAAAFNDPEYLERYLQLPPELPERVINLAQDLTADLQDPVDKAIALRDYLRRTYPYTMDPSPVPAGRDFVDYFLFEEKQGYCTYHSTALVVLLRSTGLPARWVAGYVVNAGGSDPLSAGVDYEVSNANAHAWVEVFIPGYGWVELDPTPRFAGFERVESLPELPDSGETAPIDPGGGTPGPGPGEDWRDELNPGDEATTGGQQSKTPTWVFVAGLLGLILAGLAGRLGLRLWQSYQADRYALLGPSGAVRLYSHVFGLLDELGMNVAEHMTAREVLETVRESASNMPELARAMEELVPAVELYLYAGVEPNRDSLEDIDRAWAAGAGRLRKAYGLRRMLRARLVSSL